MTKDRLLKGLYRGEIPALQEIITMLENDSIIIIPEGATNGDMIKITIPNAEIQESMTTIGLKIPESLRTCDFDKRWWNSPYRKEQEW